MGDPLSERSPHDTRCSADADRRATVWAVEK